MSNPDEEVKQLNVLATFHYVLGSILCIPLVIATIVVYFLSGFFLFPPWLLLPFASMGVLKWALPICIFITAWNLKRKTHYTFCFVIACIECILVPFGTILGIFTIIALSKDSVKAIFNNVNPNE